MRNRILQRLEDKKRKYQIGGIRGSGISEMSLMQHLQSQNQPISQQIVDNSAQERVRQQELINQQQMHAQQQALQQADRGPQSFRIRRQDGGIRLPGGEMEQIPGSDAVAFSGATHDQGGIMMDPQTEVEDGETMDQVTMASKGGKRPGRKADYFFSSYLKEGGRSFADMHKDVLANGGNQEDIDYLARMQEKSAGRKGNKVAKLGGIMQYQNGGKDFTKISTQTVPSEVFYDKEKYGEIKKMQGYKRYTLDNGKKIKLYGDEHLFEQIKSKGVDSWLKDMYDNADPAVMEAAGITSYDQMGNKKSNLAYQRAWNAANPDNPIKEDSLWGEQTTRTMYKEEPEKEKIPQPTETIEEIIEEGEDETVVNKERKKDYSNSLLGLAGMIPAVMAFSDKPDYMAQPDLMAPGIVKAERVAKQHLDRVDFNDQLARNSADATAVNKAIDTSGGGPASIANKMAMYAKKQQGDREIQAQEERANIAISNEEANMDLKRKELNSQAALDASKFNVTAQGDASKTNLRSKMYADEFNRGADAATSDRKLNAVQYGINTLATLHRDKLAYNAQQDYTSAIAGNRGILERRYDANGNPITSSSESSKSSTTSDKTSKYSKIKTITNADGTTTIVKYDKEGNVIPNEDTLKTAQRGGYRQLNLMRRYGE